MLSPELRAKVARLIPLLGSNHDGEVLGAARGIGRTLDGAGADLHDLAAVLLALPPPEPEFPDCRVHPGGWGGRAREIMLCQAATPWEREFAASIARWVNAGRSLSQKQQDTLDRIFAERCGP